MMEARRKYYQRSSLLVLGILKKKRFSPDGTHLDSVGELADLKWFYQAGPIPGCDLNQLESEHREPVLTYTGRDR